MRAKKPIAGFTLPEVLTSVVIVGLVLVSLYSCWAAVLSATQSSAIAVQDTQRERMAIRAITDALAGVSWYEHRTEEPLSLNADMAPATKFSRLKLISRVPPGFWGERDLADYPLRRIEFLTEDTPKDKPGAERKNSAKKSRQLVMIQQPLLAPTNSVNAHRTVLLPHVETFAVEVHSGGTNTTWEAFWPTMFETNGLPVQAKVRLGAGKEHPRTSTLPIFANQASHAKGPPAIGNIRKINDVTFGEDGFDVDDSDSAARVIFIIDKSGSMSGARLAMAKEALLQSLRNMGQGEESAAKGKFYIYFFNRKSEAMPSAAMLEANTGNIQRMSSWVNEQEASGGTWPSEAIKSAFTHEPTDIFLLTDGNFSAIRHHRDSDQPTVHDLINSLNAEKKVKVNTLAVGESLRGQEGETVLMMIAKENGGAYTFIDPNSLAPDPTSPPPIPKK
ncbi:MAG: VWA domain-containing protein [Verrucomicrobiota bacterium]|jgi:prepilin-type N-terminal cleavage/methylation domain-containing protein|nr:VWA domain-containing protein [Verrucomicrobiota bacterium]